MNRHFTEIEMLRRNKIQKLRSQNINPFARNVRFSHNSKQLHDQFGMDSKLALEHSQPQVSAVFRIMNMRGPFLIGKDAFGSLQAYVTTNIDQASVSIRKFLDIGDIIKVSGTMMKTNTGELTIRARHLQLVTKSLKQLPEKFHGLKDVEKRYRRRYVDLIINDDIKDLFWKRTRIISAIRSFFDGLGYMEVDTPILTPILGGAAARPFKTHHNALDMSFYLRIATELHLKRLLVGGIERVYEIGRLFRNEGIDTSHNPEFTTIEFYESYSNLEGMINRTEKLLMHIAQALKQPTIVCNSRSVVLQPPFKRIKMIDAVSQATQTDMQKATFEEAKTVAQQHGIEVKPYFSTGHIISQLFEKLIEDTIVEPTFVYGYPVEISPFAAKSLEDPRFTERAELFIGGREYANMFTELNDPIDQYERFKNQINESIAGNKETNELDLDFVEALEYGMPPAGGCGVGIDRLVMLFANKKSIREVLFFPHLKEKVKKDGKHG